MFCRKNWFAMTVVILSLAMFVPVAQAQRQEYDVTVCYQVNRNLVHSSPEMTIFGYDGKGIVSQSANKLFDNVTLHAVGTMKVMDGKWSSHNLSKNMGPDGDFIVWETYGDGVSGINSKPIYGTGKFKGIKGETKGKVITAGKPIVQGTNQACDRYVGWIELAK